MVERLRSGRHTLLQRVTAQSHDLAGAINLTSTPCGSNVTIATISANLRKLSRAPYAASFSVETALSNRMLASLVLMMAPTIVRKP
jgi:hypothetical protein